MGGGLSGVGPGSGHVFGGIVPTWTGPVKRPDRRTTAARQGIRRPRPIISGVGPEGSLDLPGDRTGRYNPRRGGPPRRCRAPAPRREGARNVMVPTPDQVRDAAYYRWLGRHGAHGHDRHDW